MNACNQVTLTGYLGQDVETKVIGEKNQVTKFSLATSYATKDKDGNKQSITDWHRIECWNSTSKYASYLKKGDLVTVNGSIKYAKYINKEGKEVTSTVIVVNNIQCLVKSDSSNSNGTASTAKAEAEKQTAEYVGETTPGFSNDSNDDLPF